MSKYCVIIEDATLFVYTEAPDKKTAKKIAVQEFSINDYEVNVDSSDLEVIVSATCLQISVEKEEGV